MYLPAGGFAAPHGNFQGGGVAPPVNYAPAPSFPIAAIPVGAYKPQSSGIGVGGIALTSRALLERGFATR